MIIVQENIARPLCFLAHHHYPPENGTENKKGFFLLIIFQTTSSLARISANPSRSLQLLDETVIQNQCHTNKIIDLVITVTVREC